MLAGAISVPNPNTFCRFFFCLSGGSMLSAIGNCSTGPYLH